MPYESFCHTCNRSTFLKDAGSHWKEGTVVCPRCGSEEVEQTWFYVVTAKQSA